MSSPLSIVVVSDLHYASEAEKIRRGHEQRVIPSPGLRLLAWVYRRFFWLRDPLAHNHLLDRFLAELRPGDWLIANGDYSCDTAFVGVSDDAAFASAATCLGRLRERAWPRFRAVMGDHELGKMSLFGGAGGLRLASWQRCVEALELDPFWRLDLGRYTLLGLTSSLLDLPVFEPEALPHELGEWRRLRAEHLEQIRAALASLPPSQRLLLFVHDPTCLPYLWEAPEVRARAGQIEATWIGHLHTPIILWKARLLAGMPPIRFLGNSVRRMSEALRRARSWRPFRVRLCPSLAGIELSRQGGYYRLELHPGDAAPPVYRHCRLPW